MRPGRRRYAGLVARAGVALAGVVLAGVVLAGVALAAAGGRPGSVPAATPVPPRPRLVVGAKRFTESAVLAEVMAQLVERHLGVEVERRFNLAGTDICFGALANGAIDLYVEYSGTALRSLLGDQRRLAAAAALAVVRAGLERRFGVAVLAPFGFDNSYALAMRRDRAFELGITQLSDLGRHPLRFGFSHEFVGRADGLAGLRQQYALQVARLVELDHDLAYRALDEGAIDVLDAYGTDAKLSGGRLLVLADDLGFFPPYEGVPLVRREALRRFPGLESTLALIAGRIDTDTMRRLNAEVEGLGRTPANVATRLLLRLGLTDVTMGRDVRSRGLLALLLARRGITLRLAGQHLLLTGLATLLACLIGVPLGLVAARRARVATLVLGVVGVLQTVPSLALLAFMLPLFGIGTRPAIVALLIYGLLPIVRNTIAGLRAVEPRLLEVGRGLGMTPAQLLRRVELPLAVPVILAGIRTAAVITVGTATLAAFIGAGGLGEPIVSGLSMNDFRLVLSGALPAALLALALDGALWALERLATPRGLRLAAARSRR
ncbi:MAG: ABC transporter permease subunit [Proteobacteria bacterium]|nr:ABC transporter permease subunit [Pseudomonadota bacterium]